MQNYENFFTTAIHFAVALSNVSVSSACKGIPQQERITINLKNVKIVEFFQEIEKITAYKFFYKTSQIEVVPLISVETKDLPLTSVLDLVFAKAGLTYTLNDNQIVVQQKEGKQSKARKRLQEP